MPIVVVQLPRIEGMTREQLVNFVDSLLGHSVFTRSRANGKARPGIKAALRTMADDYLLRLAAEPDHACLKLAAETPQKELYEIDPTTGKATFKGYEDGYHLTAAGLDRFMPIIDAIVDAVEESVLAAAEPPAAVASPRV